jgi:hypothetical protein
MLRDLSDVHFPDAAKIALVQDNLNSSAPGRENRKSPPRQPAREGVTSPIRGRRHRRPFAALKEDVGEIVVPHRALPDLQRMIFEHRPC